MVRVSAFVCALLCALALVAVTPVIAQQAPAAAPPPQPAYGSPITLDQAKRVMAAAELEAAKNSWAVAITILDSGGNMVMFHKGDNTQLSGISTSAGKARTALEFKLPSKALDDAIAAGGAGMRLLALKDITPLQGGLPAPTARRTIRSPKPAPMSWRRGCREAASSHNFLERLQPFCG